jgi:hypothetical protein
MPTADELTAQLKLAQLQQQLAEARCGEAKALKETAVYAKGNTPAAKADKSPPTKPTPEVQTKDAAKATNDLIAAYSKALKDLAVTAPDGKITATGEFIEVRVLAQRTLAKVMADFLNDFSTTWSNILRSAEKNEKQTTGNGGTQGGKQLEETGKEVTAGREQQAVHGTGKEVIQEPRKLEKKEETKSLTVTLVLIQPADVAALELYDPTLTRLQLAQKNYAKAIQQAKLILEPEGPKVRSAMFSPAIALPVMAATTIVSSAAKLLALFRTTTNFTNTSFQVDSTLLTSTLVQAARRQTSKDKKINWQIFAPSLFPIDALQEKASPFLEALTALEELHSDSQHVIHALEVRAQALLIQDAQQNFAEVVNTHLNRLKAFDESYSQLHLDLTATDGPLIPLTRSERLVNKLQETNTYPVILTATSKGSMRIRGWLFNSDRLHFSAGTELSYLVFEKDGAILCAGSACDYTPYIESAKIPEKIHLTE